MTFLWVGSLVLDNVQLSFSRLRLSRIYATFFKKNYNENLPFYDRISQKYNFSFIIKKIYMKSNNNRPFLNLKIIFENVCNWLYLLVCIFYQFYIHIMYE